MTARNRTGRSERAVRTSIAAAWLALATPALSDAQGELEAVRACATEQDDARRLACYDRVVRAPTQPAPAQSPSAQAKAAPSAPAPAATATAANDADAKFGYRGAIARRELDEKAQREGGVDHLEAAVVDVARRPRGELVLTLDNGQVWAQKTADSSRVKAGDRVTVKKASFNSFLLVLPNNRAIRVTREK